VKPEFLNVDLEVITRTDPAPLVRALEKKCSVLYAGRYGRHDYLAVFEVPAVRASPERRLIRFCNLLDSLPFPAVQMWKQARSRTFDLGFRSGDRGQVLALGISPQTLRRIAALDATLATTIYPTNL
jgi:hypothetical protein